MKGDRTSSAGQGGHGLTTESSRNWPFVIRTSSIVGLICAVVALAAGGCCCPRKYWRDPPVPHRATALISAWKGPDEGAWGGRPHDLEILRQALAECHDSQLALQLADLYQDWAVCSEREGGPATELYYLAAGYSWVAAE